MLEKHLIQIAGVIDAAEAQLLRECGVRYLGFPLRLPVNREDLSEAAAAAIIRGLHPPSFGVLITYLDEANEVIALCKFVGVRIVQLHGEIDVSELQRLKTMEPDWTVVKSLVVGLHNQATLEATVRNSAPYVDAFITDTFDPKSGASGATGKTHDWNVSRRLVELSERPVILAGGLTPENVQEAIFAVRPFGVDAHTGVEDGSGRKSRDKVSRFVSQARAAFQRTAGQQRRTN